MALHMLTEMTRDEFQEMLEAVVERAVESKLLELLGDPDEGLTLQESVRNRLIRQHQAVVDGARGVALDEALHQLELT